MTGDSTSIRVASWNIRAAIGPGEPFPSAWWRHVDRGRLARIAQRIHGFDADAVALQEVAVFNVNGDLVDEPAELARLAGMHVRYGAVHAFALIEPEDGRAVGAASWGNAVLTRRPIEDAFTIGLPMGADDDLVEPAGSGLPLAGIAFREAEPGAREPRCAVGGRLAGLGIDLFIVNAHLTYAGTGQRHEQAVVLSQIAGSVKGPVIVAGDFNAPIEAPELQPLALAFDDAFAAVGVAPGDPLRESCGPHRIDHLLTRGMRTLDCFVDRGAGDASDHLPAIGTFELLTPDQAG